MIELVHEMNKNYIKITSDEDEKAENYGMKMVENNRIEGLLPLKSVSVNNRTSFFYEISGRISLEEKYAVQEFSAKDVEYIAAFIKNLFAAAKRYMLDSDGLLFEPSYIFCNIGDGNWEMVYNSGMAKETRKGLRKLFEFILNRLDHKDQKAVVAGYGLYKRVCREEIALEQLFDPAKEIFGGINEEVQAEYELQERVIPEIMPLEVTEEREADSRKIFGKRADKIRLFTAGCIGLFGAVAAMFFWIFPSIGRMKSGETGAAGLVAGSVVFLAALLFTAACVWLYRKESGEFGTIESRRTTVPYTLQTPGIFSRKKAQDPEETPTMLISGGDCAMLRRVAKRGEETSGEEYELRDSPVCLGSGSQADVMLEYEGISRIHARISREGEMLFIKDMNSTNGTWVNNRRLSIYELCPLKHKDIIRLADTSFELIDTVCQ